MLPILVGGFILGAVGKLARDAAYTSKVQRDVREAFVRSGQYYEEHRRNLERTYEEIAKKAEEYNRAYMERNGDQV